MTATLHSLTLQVEELELPATIHVVDLRTAAVVEGGGTAMKFTIKQGDTFPALRATLQQADGVPLDLTGATVHFAMADLRGNPKVSAAATVIDALAGVVEYRWAAADTDTAATYQAEFQVTFAGGSVISVPNDDYITVRIARELVIATAALTTIKSGNLDPAFLDEPQIIDNAFTLGMNTVNVPVEVNYDSATSSMPVIHEQRFAQAKTMVSELHANGFRVILEPFNFILGGGGAGETALDPSDVSLWFANYTNICERILNELGVPEGVWGFDVASNLVNIEFDQDNPSNPYPNAAAWDALFAAVRNIYSGVVMYRTNFWWNDTVRDLTKNNPLWANSDLLAIDAWFELNDQEAVPSVDQLIQDLHGTTVGSRNQDVYQELLDFHNAQGKPIYFGGWGAPALEFAAFHPWDVAVSETPSEQAQANLFAAYQAVFEAREWFIGYSLWTINSTDSYNVMGNLGEAVIQQFLGNLSPVQAGS